MIKRYTSLSTIVIKCCVMFKLVALYNSDDAGRQDQGNVNKKLDEILVEVYICNVLQEK